MIDLEIFSSGQHQPGPSPDQPGGTVFRGILTKTDTGAELRTRDTLHTTASKRSIRRFVITETAPTRPTRPYRAFSYYRFHI